MHFDPPLQLGLGEEGTPALAPIFPGVDAHSEEYGRTDFGGHWGCSGCTATRLVDTQAEWELLEDGLGLILALFGDLVVEDHRLGFDSLLHCTHWDMTLLRIPQSENCKSLPIRVRVTVLKAQAPSL